MDDKREDEPYAPPRSAALPAPAAGSVALGCGLGGLLHMLVGAGVLIYFERRGDYGSVSFLLTWGLVQLGYLLPLALGFLLARRRRTARGVFLCALVSLLLWGACTGALVLG